MGRRELISSIGRVLRELDLMGKNLPPDEAASRTLEGMRNTLAKQQLELAMSQIELEGDALLKAEANLQAINADISMTQSARQTLMLNTLPQVVKEVGDLLDSASH